MTSRQTWLLGSDCPGAFAFLQEPWGSSSSPPTASLHPASSPPPVAVIQALSKSTASPRLAPATRTFLQPPPRLLHLCLLLTTGQREWFHRRNLSILPLYPSGAPQCLEDKNSPAPPGLTWPSTSPPASPASSFPITPPPGLRDHHSGPESTTLPPATGPLHTPSPRPGAHLFLISPELPLLTPQISVQVSPPQGSPPAPS